MEMLKINQSFGPASQRNFLSLSLQNKYQEMQRRKDKAVSDSSLKV